MPGSRGSGFQAQIQNTSLLPRMQAQLALTTNQYAEIERIMLASQERTKPLWTNIEPGMQRELARVHEEIRQVLNADQQRKFAEMLQSRPRRPEGPPAREGDSYRSRTNRFRTNGTPTNGQPAVAPPSRPSALPPALPATNGV
ncbi:MAG: hypothetical protein ABSF38_09855 [Verrucomicrobiota bacterium]